MIPVRLSEKIERLFSGQQDVFRRNLFTVIGIVMVRRGVRHLLDEYLFPSQPTLSSLISIVIGIAILYIPNRSLSVLGGHEPHIPNFIQRIQRFFADKANKE